MILDRFLENLSKSSSTSCSEQDDGRMVWLGGGRREGERGEGERGGGQRRGDECRDIEGGRREGR